MFHTHTHTHTHRERESNTSLSWTDSVTIATDVKSSSDKMKSITTGGAGDD